MNGNALHAIDDHQDISLRYCDIRRKSLSLCASLQLDDYGVQSMPDASPIKWHLAHTTWFFERFVLSAYLPDYRPFGEAYERLFNSYYQSVGPQYPREKRGLLSRPTVDEVLRYRQHVDERIQYLLAARNGDASSHNAIELGLQHEQQHQELMLTDIKHAFFNNPLLPTYRERVQAKAPSRTGLPLQFVEIEGGVRWIGADGDDFHFDNERPRHRVIVEPFSLANRLATNEEYLAFVRTGGYRRADLWLADGWSTVCSEGWDRPLYWHESLDSEFTLRGVRTLLPNAPVCHLSYYEADAFARWAGMRLPTEFEWEATAVGSPVNGNFIETDALHPLPAQSQADPVSTDQPKLWQPRQLFGDVWEWTASSYSAYPRYQIPAGPVGEYNGKFMCNQMVLRGGSCATAREHARVTYRNFFHPSARWQFSGVRLAR